MASKLVYATRKKFKERFRLTITQNVACIFRYKCNETEVYQSGTYPFVYLYSGYMCLKYHNMLVISNSQGYLCYKKTNITIQKNFSTRGQITVQFQYKRIDFLVSVQFQYFSTFQYLQTPCIYNRYILRLRRIPIRTFG